MRPELPTELLWRLMNASDGQLAAVEKILSAGPMDLPAPVTEDVARAAFALLIQLDAQGIHKPPPPLTVFRLYCVDGCSADRVARKCRCAKGTVMSRLRFIESVTHTKAEDFRAMSAHLQQLDDDLNASGARNLYRRGLANESDSDWSSA